MKPTTSPWLHMLGRGHSVRNWILIGKSPNLIGWTLLCRRNLVTEQIWVLVQERPQMLAETLRGKMSAPLFLGKEFLMYPLPPNPNPNPKATIQS